MRKFTIIIFVALASLIAANKSIYASLEILPDELLCLVASFLSVERVGDFAELSTRCKSAAFDDCVMRVHMHSYRPQISKTGMPKIKQYFLRYLPRVQCLDVNETSISDRGFAFLLRRITQLTSLSANSCKQLSDRSIACMQRHSANLQALSLIETPQFSIDHLIDLLNNCTSLEILHLSSATIESASWHVNEIGENGTLRTLRIASETEMDGSFVDLVAKFNALTNLSLACICTGSLENLFVLLQDLPRLRSLRIDQLTSFCDEEHTDTQVLEFIIADIVDKKLIFQAVREFSIGSMDGYTSSNMLGWAKLFSKEYQIWDFLHPVDPTESRKEWSDVMKTASEGMLTALETLCYNLHEIFPNVDSSTWDELYKQLGFQLVTKIERETLGERPSKTRFLQQLTVRGFALVTAALDVGIDDVDKVVEALEDEIED